LRAFEIEFRKFSVNTTRKKCFQLLLANREPIGSPIYPAEQQRQFVSPLVIGGLLTAGLAIGKIMIVAAAFPGLAGMFVLLL
jgi:hypothetical protein